MLGLNVARKMAKSKKPKKKIRNPYAQHAMARKGGSHQDKRTTKKAQQKQKERELNDE